MVQRNGFLCRYTVIKSGNLPLEFFLLGTSTAHYLVMDSVMRHHFPEAGSSLKMAFGGKDLRY